jgi:hypothetical protein
MRRSGQGSGGGHGSKNIVHPGVRKGSGSKSTNPGAAGQIGQSQGSHVTNKGDTGYRGEIFHKPPNFQPVPFGNETALNVKRTNYGQSGSQGCHGQPAPGNAPAKNRDILSEFGPESKRS